MTIVRTAREPAPAWPRPAACLGCPDCRGTCWEVVAMRLIPDCILNRREWRG
jgi:hypothetical protein